MKKFDKFDLYKYYSYIMFILMIFTNIGTAYCTDDSYQKVATEIIGYSRFYELSLNYAKIDCLVEIDDFKIAQFDGKQPHQKLMLMGGEIEALQNMITNRKYCSYKCSTLSDAHNSYISTIFNIQELNKVGFIEYTPAQKFIYFMENVPNSKTCFRDFLIIESRSKELTQANLSSHFLDFLYNLEESPLRRVN